MLGYIIQLNLKNGDTLNIILNAPSYEYENEVIKHHLQVYKRPIEKSTLGELVQQGLVARQYNATVTEGIRQKVTELSLPKRRLW